MITSGNFAHIEKVGEVAVLFYVEYEGDQIVIHQCVLGDVGGVNVSTDIKLTFAAKDTERFEKSWPALLEGDAFAARAAAVIDQLREFGVEL